MNRSKLLLASIGGAMILSFAQFASATEIAANAEGARDTQYNVAMAKCAAGASADKCVQDSGEVSEPRFREPELSESVLS